MLSTTEETFAETQEEIGRERLRHAVGDVLSGADLDQLNTIVAEVLADGLKTRIEVAGLAGGNGILCDVERRHVVSVDLSTRRLLKT